MKPILSVTAALAASMLIAQPCLAAEDLRDQSELRYRSSPYAGATFRVSLEGARKAGSSLRLQAGIRRIGEGRGAAASAHPLQLSAVELGASADGMPVVYLAGQEARDLRQRLGVRGSTGKTLLIVGGVLVLVVLVGLMSSGGQLGPCTEPGC